MQLRPLGRNDGVETPDSLSRFSRTVHHLGAYSQAAPGGLRADPVTHPGGPASIFLAARLLSFGHYYNLFSAPFMAHFSEAQEGLRFDRERFFASVVPTVISLSQNNGTWSIENSQEQVARLSSLPRRS